MTKQQHYPPTCPICGASFPHDNPMAREYHERSKRDEVERIQENLIRFFQDVNLYLLKEALYDRLPGIEVKFFMKEGSSK